MKITIHNREGTHVMLVARIGSYTHTDIFYDVNAVALADFEATARMVIEQEIKGDQE